MATKTTKTEDVTNETEETVETEVSRIPSAFDNNPLFITMFKEYLDVVDAIDAYNAEVLKKSDSEWNRHKILSYAKLEARPIDANAKPDEDLLPLVQELENIQEALNFARDAVISKAAEKLGVSLSVVSGERDPEKENALKDLRKKATTIGSSLGTMASVLVDKTVTDGITEFLAKYPLPAVGREQAKAFGGDNAASTPRYRVKVTVKKDGNVLLEEDGFTKACLGLLKPVFGYNKTDNIAPKADKLRAVWEGAGNSPGNTVTPVVEFEDNGLQYTLTYRN